MLAQSDYRRDEKIARQESVKACYEEMHEGESVCFPQDTGSDRKRSDPGRIQARTGTWRDPEPASGARSGCSGG